jgi:hypothetical protein
VPSVANQSPARRDSFRVGIVRTLLVQVVVLVALSGAVAGYLNWSSDIAWMEFSTTHRHAVPVPKAPIQTVKDGAPCDLRI